jgi:hypothetical protein
MKGGISPAPVINRLIIFSVKGGYPHMPMPNDDVNKIIKAMMPINHLSSSFILTS